MEQTSLFPNEIEQQELIENLLAMSAERVEPSALLLSNEDIDRALRLGSGYEDGKLRIAAFYVTHPSPKAAQEFLKEEYGVGGRSHTYLTGVGGFIDYDGKGIRFSARHFSDQMRLRWPAVEQHIHRMVEEGKYLTADEQSRFDDMMRSMAGQEIPVPIPRAHYPPVKVETVLGESTLDLPATREINRGDIESAIQAWNGSMESKHAVSRYIGEGHSTDEIAVFLRQQYGDDLPAFPVTLEGAAADISWNQAAEITREMVQEDRFFTGDEREEAARLSREADAASKYKLGFGIMGNGITVWNELEYEHGDYKTVAHIDTDRTVKFYDDAMPESVKARIIREAETANPTISATQDALVFSTPPREKTHPSLEEAANPAIDKQVYETPRGLVYQAGDEVDWNTGTGESLHLRIDSITDENVHIIFLDKADPISTNINRQSVELQIDSGRFIVQHKEHSQSEHYPSAIMNEGEGFEQNYGQTVFLPMSPQTQREYDNLKRQYPDTIIGLEREGYFEFYGEDAQQIAVPPEKQRKRTRS
ncbi:MAG: hypothetical protein IJ189_01400 [Clostridia bacterium]|nr:hypothetical protein [Clostridia bacterium]